MRRITFYFLYAELLDIETTILGIRAGGTELNPLLDHIGWGGLILFKLSVILLITIILQKKRPFQHDIIIPCFAVLFPAWNSFMLLLSMYP